VGIVTRADVLGMRVVVLVGGGCVDKAEVEVEIGGTKGVVRWELEVDWDEEGKSVEWDVVRCNAGPWAWPLGIGADWKEKDGSRLTTILFALFLLSPSPAAAPVPP